MPTCLEGPTVGADAAMPVKDDVVACDVAGIEVAELDCAGALVIDGDPLDTLDAAVDGTHCEYQSFW